MLTRRPLILLLGGLLTAGSVGCSAFQTVVGDRLHRGSRRSTSAERMVAVGRVFENQGKYDQAAGMYQSALRVRPNDPVIRQQLNQVMARRSSSPVAQGGPTGSAGALALANTIPVRSDSEELSGQQNIVPGQPVVRPSESGVASHSSASQAGVPVDVPKIQLTSENTEASMDGCAVSQAVMLSSGSTVESGKQESIEGLPAGGNPDPRRVAVSHYQKNSRSSVVAAAGAAIGVDGSVRRASSAVPVDMTSSVSPVSRMTEVTLSEVREASRSASTHVELLLRAVEFGDCAETQSLAAALLAECDLNDFRIRDVLAAAQESAADFGLLLAIADTQLHRGEATSDTAKSLQALALCHEPEYQIQALTSLRHFAGTAHDQETVRTLESLLTHQDETVRSTAAVTLGDFVADGSETDEYTLTVLTRVASEDRSETVRHAARAALQRRSEGPNEFAVPIHASELRQVQH